MHPVGAAAAAARKGCPEAQAEQAWQRCEACSRPAGAPLSYMPGKAKIQGMLTSQNGGANTLQ